MLRNYHEKFVFSLAISLVVWAIIAFAFYQINSRQSYLDFELTSSAIEFVFDVSFCITSFVMYRKVRPPLKKHFFILFTSLFFLALAEGGYLYAIYAAGLDNQTVYYQSMYNAPFILFLFCQLMFLSSLVDKKIFYTSNKLYLGLFFIFSFFGMTIFMLSTCAIDYFSYQGAYDVITGAIEFVIFDLAMLVLICTRNSGLSFICTGVIVLIASNLWEKYLFDISMLNKFDYSDMTWLLGQILLFFGLFYSYSQQFSFRIETFKKIKNQISLWIFSLMTLCFLLLISVGYISGLINKSSIISLPFLMMIFAVVMVLFSSYIGTRFERPFEILKNDIIMLTNAENERPVFGMNLVADEFVFLQKFIISAFRSQSDNNKEIQSLGNIALQVAHDIRSPVSAIMMLTKDCSEIPEVQRSALRDAANRIQDIANYLLGQHRKNTQDNSILDNFLASASVLSVLSEKRVEYKDRRVQFLYEADNEACFVFINANIIEFKRMVSNIINNAVDAILDEGIVSVKLISDEQHLTVSIIDNGVGIPDHVKNEILHNTTIASQKITGHGFGLSHAKATLKSCDGELKILTDHQCGTEIKLIFKKHDLPLWMTNEIEFYVDDCIVILDDDSSIHCAWDKLFKRSLAGNASLKVAHFADAKECIKFLQSYPNKNRLLLLVDYELLKQDLNGLDVIEMTQIERSLLVTSHYENIDIIKRAILLNTKVLPKMLASNVKLSAHSFSSRRKPLINDVDLILLEDNEEFSSVLSYLYSAKGKRLVVYNDSYDLLENISNYSKKTYICFDYCLNSHVNGIELAKVLFEKGFTNLFLATGFQMKQEELPPYLILLNEKMELLNL